MNVLRLTLRQLQIFAAVARRGSTTLASRDVALSQSATSSALGELERLLAVRLFDRVGKRLVMNENGRTLLPRALALLDGAAGIEELAHQDGAPLRALRIGASTTIGNYVLPRLFGRQLFGPQDRPGTGWPSRVCIANTEVVCDGVAAFELDVGLIEGPCTHPTLRVTPWLRDELVVVCAPSTLRAITARNDGRVSTASLREQLWLLREPGSGTREVTDQLLLPRLHEYRDTVEIGSSEAIQRMAAEGMGVACLSRWVVEEQLRSGRLCAVPTLLPSLHRQFYRVMHRDKAPTASLEHFLTLSDSAQQ
ncbi:MAG TPA: LysR family transcriptional regulator [Steroidobacteraceae bacterium]|nr:LysR family transcriptional regulator [Steroidobacteraceae bacterium]